MVRWAFTRELAPSACMTMSAVRVAPQDKVLWVLFYKFSFSTVYLLLFFSPLAA